MWRIFSDSVSAIVFLVLAVAAWAFTGGQAGAVGAAQANTTVSMTDYLFTPRDLTVFGGTTVV